MDSPNQLPHPELIITSPRWIKWLMGFCLVVFVGMGVIWVGAYFEEGLSGLVVGGGLTTLVISLLTLFITNATFQSFHFFADHLVWHRWGQQVSIPFQAIRSVAHNDRLVIETFQSRYKIYFPLRDTQNGLHTALEARVPVLIAAKKARLARPLPIRWTPRLSAKGTNIFFFLLMGPGFLAFGGGAIWHSFTSSSPWWENAAVFFFGLLAIAIALLMSWMFFDSFVWSIVLDHDQIRVRHFFKTSSYPTALLKKMTVDHEIRTYRGISRQAWFLRFDFADGQTFQFEPTENGVANGFAPQSDRKFLLELQQTLTPYYLPPDAYDIDPPSPPETLPADEWGQPAVMAVESAGGRRRPRDQLVMILNHIRHWPEQTLLEEFEALRDLLHELGWEILPDLLDEANQPRSRHLQELLITVLVDHGYPPAFPYFVDWLDHENEQIRFAAAMALDHQAGGHFAIEKMIVDGWVQHDQIAAAVPDIRRWWLSEGRQQVPSLADWVVQKETSRPATEQEKRFNFVELNPFWVMQGDGIVQPPTDGYTLPLNKGVHIVGGQVTLRGESEIRFAAFEMDSHAQDVLAIYARLNGGWREIKALARSFCPNISFAAPGQHF